MSELQRPEMEQVWSTSVAAVGYDHESERLFVRFKGFKEVYHSLVPVEAHEAFMASESKGKFYHQNIRRQFPVTEL